MEFAHGAIQWLAANAVSTVYTVSGLSFQPKALRFYWQGLQSAIDASSNAITSRRGVGFAASTSNRGCSATQDQVGALAMTCTAGIFTDCVVATVGSAPARDGALDLNSITADGFTLIVDDQGVSNITVFWEAWGGAEISDAAVSTITESGATGNVTYTTGNGSISGGNFQPSVVMFTGTQNTSLDTAVRQDSGLSVGWMTGVPTSPSATVIGNNDDGSAAADTDGSCQSACLGMVAVAGGNLNMLAIPGVGVAPFTTTGYTLSWSNRASTRQVLVFCIRGGAWESQAYLMQGNTLLSPTTLAAVSFIPIGMLFLTRGLALNTGATTTAEDVVCLGTASSTTSRRSMGTRSENGVATAEIDLAMEYDQCLVVPDSAGGVLSAYDVTTFSQRPVIAVDVAGGVANEAHFALIFGSSVLPAPRRPFTVSIGA